MAVIPSIYEAGLLAWLVIAAALLIWVALLWGVTALLLRSRERVHCPVAGREASVVFVRAPDGSKDDVLRCSLHEQEAPVTCEKECLEPARPG